MFPEHVSLVFLTTSHLLEAEKKPTNLDILVSKIHFHFSSCLLDQIQKKYDMTAIMSSPVFFSLFALFRDQMRA